jgi:hypothetical protein
LSSDKVRPLCASRSFVQLLQPDTERVGKGNRTRACADAWWLDKIRFPEVRYIMVEFSARVLKIEIEICLLKLQCTECQITNDPRPWSLKNHFFSRVKMRDRQRLPRRPYAYTDPGRMIEGFFCFCHAPPLFLFAFLSSALQGGLTESQNGNTLHCYNLGKGSVPDS